MAAGFSQEQITTFRQIFSRHMDGEAGGVREEQFPLAILDCLRQTSVGSSPSEQELRHHFHRLSGGSGLVKWQNFFQVLIYLQSSHNRLSQLNFDGNAPQAPEISSVQPSAPPAPTPPAHHRGQSIGRTLRRGGAAFGRVVGNFFGVTDESQHGSAQNIGWETFTQRRTEESSIFQTLARRPSQRVPAEPPPDYAGLGLEGEHSFDPSLLDDEEEEDEMGGDMFISRAPPDYNSIVQEGPPSSSGGGVRFRGGDEIRVSVIPEIPHEVVIETQGYPAPTQQRVQVPTQSEPEEQRSEEFLYNPQQAMEYYHKFIKAEKRLRHRRHHEYAVEFFGGDNSAGGGRSSTGGRRERIDPQRADGVQRRPGRRPKRTKLQRQSTLIRREVETLPTFWPIFTILVTVAELAIMIVLVSLMGFAPINYQSIAHVEEFRSLNNTEGNRTDLFTFFRSSNLWIGPTPSVLVEVGAKFSPCMREEHQIRIRTGQFFGPFDDGDYGCCRNSENIGTTVLSECGVFNSGPSSNVTELSYLPSTFCSNASILPNFHPCCISLTGHCAIMDQRQCIARGGIFHEDLDSCFEVNCLKSICGFRGAYVGDNPRLPTANQFWRWFLAIFTHLGLIHVVVVLTIQAIVGVIIERNIGWLRIGLIYIISGVGGNILSAVFAPYEVNAGASGAVFGLLGVLYVELFQFWQIKDYAWLELVLLTGTVLVFLALGTLPYVDNWAHIGGLLYGVPSAIVFVPYITFGRWDSYRKRIALLICIPLLIVLLVAGFLTFYLFRDSFCPQCQYINCVPYSPGLCPEEYINADPPTFSL